MQSGYIKVDSLLKYSTPYFRLVHLTASLTNPLAQGEGVLEADDFSKEIPPLGPTAEKLSNTIYQLISHNRSTHRPLSLLQGWGWGG